MSNILYDFLTESVLFNEESIESNFSSITDRELKKELSNYREFVLNNSELNKELTRKNDELTIQTESFGRFLPDKKLLKQLALYMDKVIVNDWSYVNIMDTKSQTFLCYTSS